MKSLQERSYQEIRAKIENKKKNKDVCLIAVSKKQPKEKIEALYKLGHRDFGENYVQELLKKDEDLKHLEKIRWHFLGHLQRNKVKMLLPKINCLHTLDSIRLADEIEKHAKKEIATFIQVNIDNEPSKSGVLVQDLEELIKHLEKKERIRVLGLMGIPSPENSHAAFQKLFELSQKFKGTIGEELSMGMSNDFEKAISCGATYVRVGTALFGERK